jgi:hypothetical protein
LPPSTTDYYVLSSTSYVFGIEISKQSGKQPFFVENVKNCYAKKIKKILKHSLDKFVRQVGFFSTIMHQLSIEINLLCFSSRNELLKTHTAAWVQFSMGKETRPGLWTNEEILKAIGLRRLSKKAYNFIRENRLCPLPGMSTLRAFRKNHPELNIPTVGRTYTFSFTKRLFYTK